MGMAGLIFEPHPPNFEISTTFEDVQLMLKLFFDFSTGFRFSQISVECSVHICSCPWMILHIFCEQTENTFFYDLENLLYFLLLYRNCGHPRATQDFYPSFLLNSSK